MADKQSREGLVMYCFPCNRESVVLPSDPRKDGRACSQCGGHLHVKRPIAIEDTKSAGQIKLDVDCEDALKGLKAVQREAKKATAALKELEATEAIMTQGKLLTIQLDRADSVPKVIYKGEEIKGKASVNFEWKTQGDRPVVDTPKIHVEYTEVGSNDWPLTKHIHHEGRGE